MILLSIIIPVFKVEKYIRRTLESILSQQYAVDCVEIIIVNDGTPDNSMLIVDEYSSRIKNMVIINQENKGLSGARNTGLSNSRGKYIWFVDSDDWLFKGSIQNVISMIAGENKDIFCVKIREYDEGGKERCDTYSHFNKPITMSGVDFLNSNMSCAPMQQFIISRDFLLQNNLLFKEGIVHEDIEFAPRMLLSECSISYYPIVAYCYLRRTGDNITGGKIINVKRLNSLRIILEEYINYLDEEKRRQYKRAIRKVQKIVVYAIFGYSSIDQINNNYLNAFDVQSIRLYKKVIKSNLLSNNTLKNLLWDIIFLISPTMFKNLSDIRIQH